MRGHFGLSVQQQLMTSVAAVVVMASASPAMAQTRKFDVPAQPASRSIPAFAKQAGVQIVASGNTVNKKRTNAVRDSYSVEEGLRILLEGTGLVASPAGSNGIITIQASNTSGETVAGSAAADDESADIVVTGTRIRGAAATAPVFKISSDDMRRAGQSNLGDTIRSVPLNFGGGQNPGIGTTQGAANENVNGASSVNLYGLGPNATLTLLNGSRLSYTGVNAAVDISAIPAAAVDHIDIVADGASAVYGADAVAGVVNVILRRDFHGLSADGRLGSATDGGYFRQQYDVVGGTNWQGGGILAVYNYTANSAISAGSRSYTQSMSPDTTIYPGLRQHNGLISFNQEIASTLTARMDVVYNNRRQNFVQSFTNQPYTDAGSKVQADVRTLVVSPTLTARVGGDWTARLISSYGTDATRIASDIFFSGAFYGTSSRRYDNEALSIEANAEGPLLDLPAGPVRIAVGGGYRRTGIDLVSTTLGVTSRDFDRRRSNGFGYAEAFVPILSPGQGAALGRSLSLTGAFRYEANSGVDAVALPKAGLVYEPFEGLTLKGSWGRSFRLPTLYQQYSGYSAVLLPTAGYATGFPSNATFIVLVGAGPNMKPERSENWTISAEFKPGRLPGLSANLSYFHFAYKDRIATPITSAVGALNNPLYTQLITLSPSASLQQALAAGADIGLQNGTGSSYDPATVAAILDERDRNVARETYSGINLSLRYSIGAPDRQKLDLLFDGVWLTSSRQLLPGLPEATLAGTIFNPPKFRARVGTSYAFPSFSISAFANLSSKLVDDRATRYRIGGPSTFDLSLLGKVGHGFEIGAVINNVFNAKPPVIVTGSAYDTPFDSTNFSSIGRFISVNLSKAL